MLPLRPTSRPLQGKTYDVDYYFFPCDTPPSYILNFGPAPRRTFPYWSDTRDAAVGTAENGMCQSALNGVDIEYGGLRAGILGGESLERVLAAVTALTLRTCSSVAQEPVPHLWGRQRLEQHGRRDRPHPEQGGVNAVCLLE